MSKLYSRVIRTAADFVALIDDVCLPPDTTEIAGVPIQARFEDISAADIGRLSDWYDAHGISVLFEFAPEHGEELARAILGYEEVDPALRPYNWVRGRGKEKVYAWCSRNEHNRVQTSSAMGSIDKEGLVYDIAHQYFPIGPTGFIDSVGNILSIAHRVKAGMIVADELGEYPSYSVIVHVGMPPQLCAILDRNKPKTGDDQESMDRTQFTVELLRGVMGEKTPENIPATRKQLAKNLVTVRNNLWSRFQGTGYHPSKPQQPSQRQARALQQCFAESAVVDGVDQLQELLVRVFDAGLDEGGKPTHWAKYLPPAMVATLIVLLSNAEQEHEWNPGQPIAVDFELADQILDWLGRSADKGDIGYSPYIREVAAVKAQAKKPSGLLRWVFWGLLQATLELQSSDDESLTSKHFPSVTKSFLEAVAKGKTTEPIVGGYDCGKRVDDTEE